MSAPASQVGRRPLVRLRAGPRPLPVRARRRREPPPARPLDRLFALYAAAAGVALMFPGRPASWPLLAALHLAVVLIALRPGPLAAAAAWLAARRPAAARFVAGWYPLLLVPALYSELGVLNRAVHRGVYFDELVRSWEAGLFGGQPSQTLAPAAPWLPLSETLHATYLSYYFIIYGPPLLLYLAGRRAEFERMVFTLMLTFFVHYLFFIYFPVQGPRYLFPPPGDGLAEGPFFRLTHWLLEGASSQGAAFPSSHVAIAAVQTVLAARMLPRWFPVLLLMSTGLAVGTVYGGFHYAVDALAGLLLGLALVAAAPRLMRALGPGAASR